MPPPTPVPLRPRRAGLLRLLCVAAANAALLCACNNTGQNINTELPGRLCETNADCISDFVCVQGGCVPPCNAVTPCPEGSECKGGVCLAFGGECDFDFDCPLGRYCDKGRCRPIPAERPAPLCEPCTGRTGECGPNVNNLCLRSPGTGARFCGLDCSEVPCPTGYECKEIREGIRSFGFNCVPRNGSPCPEGTPVEPASCLQDGDCDVGYLCQDGVCTAGAGPECTVDGECGSGYACVDGTCLPEGGTCTADAECGAGYVCQEETCAPCDLGGDTWEGFANPFLQQYCTGCHAGYASYDAVVASKNLILSSTVDAPYTMPKDPPYPSEADRARLGLWLRCGAPQ